MVGPDGVPYDIEVSIDRLEGEKVFATARIYEIKKGLNGRTWGRLVTAQPIATSAGAPSNMTVVVGSAGDAQQSFHLRFTPAGDEVVADNSGAEAVENCARIDPKQRRH